MKASSKGRAAGGRRKPAFDETEEEPYQPNRTQEVGEFECSIFNYLHAGKFCMLFLSSADFFQNQLL